MNDALYEHLVPRKSRKSDIFIRIGLILALVIILVIGMSLLAQFAIIIVAILSFLVYTFIFTKMNVEYEYTVLNHDMDVDAIYNRTKRKRQLSFDLQKAEIIAPKTSPRLNSYRPEKVYDFSSREDDNKAYTIIMSMDAKLVSIIIEPDEGLLNHIRPWMGSKLHRD